MPQPRRQAEAFQAHRLPALLLGWLWAALMVVLALRTLAVELSLPSHLRLDELRAFAVTYSAPSLQPEWLAPLSLDPLRVHARHAACAKKLRVAVASHDFAAADMARQQCLAVVEQALAQSPANGRLWLEKARLVFEISGPTDAFHESLAASWQTAPRAGWIALERLRFAARVWTFLPENSKMRAAEDAGVIATSAGMARAMAHEYARHALVRPALADIITHRLPGKARQLLIRALQQAAP